jgi:predicted Rdx family selenoprotein
VADALRKEPDVNVELIDGGRSEFTVSVDGEVVAQMRDDGFPSVDEVRNAVRNAGTPVGKGA